MHKYKQIRPEWLCVGMSGRAGGNDREEERGRSCITTLQTMLLGLERVGAECTWLAFTKAPVMKDHLLHSSGDLLNPH